MNVFTGWAETNFAAQWCFENFVQVRGRGGGEERRLDLCAPL